MTATLSMLSLSMLSSILSWQFFSSLIGPSETKQSAPLFPCPLPMLSKRLFAVARAHCPRHPPWSLAATYAARAHFHSSRLLRGSSTIHPALQPVHCVLQPKRSKCPRWQSLLAKALSRRGTSKSVTPLLLTRKLLPSRLTRYTHFTSVLRRS